MSGLGVFAFDPGGLEVPLPVVALGAIIGVTYGLLSVGLVLVYRSNRIINFAHGEMGAFGAAIFGLFAVQFGWPYYLALPFGLVGGAGAATLAEVVVVRRLRNAPRLMSIVATLGVGQFLLVFSLAVNSQAHSGSVFPQPPGLPEFSLGALLVTPAYTGMLLAGPLVVAALAVFLRRSRFGLAIRGAAANPEAARMAGVFAGRMSSLAWALAGGVSALTAILVGPTQGLLGSGDAFGPGLLLRALVGAVVARMSSLPRALFAGIGLGIVEQVLLWNYPRGGLVEMVMFVIILGALLLQRQVGGRDTEKGSWAAVQPMRPVPEQFRRVWAVRNLGWTVAAPVLAIALALPAFLSNSDAVVVVGMFGFVIVGLSVGIVTGLGGQLSLGQFALAAVGATISYHVTSRVGNFPLGLLYAGLGAGLVSLVIGLPALRIRGALLTVTTLSFALATPAWLLSQSWMLSDGADPGRPIIGDTELDSGRSYYYFALAVLVVAFLIARNAHKSGFGRLLIAVRDNEDNARAFSVFANGIKMQGFVLAGFLAGVGGAVYGHMLSRLGPSTFAVSMSIDVVVLTVIGGVALLPGPLLGVLLVIGLPAFVPLDSSGLAATKLGQLALILYFPGGIGQKLQSVRDAIVARLAARAGVSDLSAGQADGAEPDGRGPAVRFDAISRRNGHRPRHIRADRPLLEAVDVVKHFGGVRAVDGVSVAVTNGEILGLIGPNGAGKTTFFEVLAGFHRPDAGRVVFDGADVTPIGPEARARAGLIRSFQDAALFPTLTVVQCVMVALERTTPTSFVGSLFGFSGGERARERDARELVYFMGLDAYRNRQIQELSTGTRRICELACLVALQPRLLLLDEPCSGVAQRETEALGALLLDIRRHLSTTIVIIEHDIPMIMNLSTRVMAMDTGRVIALGSPEQVRNDPAVITSYLGGDIAAIERSGATSLRTNNGAAARSASTNGGGRRPLRAAKVVSGEDPER